MANQIAQQFSERGIEGEVKVEADKITVMANITEGEVGVSFLPLIPLIVVGVLGLFGLTILGSPIFPPLRLGPLEIPAWATLGFVALGAVAIVAVFWSRKKS